MQIKLNNGAVLDVLSVNGSSRYFQGANRDSLEIQIAREEIGFDELEALTADSSNTDKLIFIDGDTEYIHDGYSLRAELSVRPVQTGEETADSPASYEERICVVLAQKTYAEKELESLRETVDALVLSAL